MNALAKDGARRPGDALRTASARQVSGENANQVQRLAQEQTQNLGLNQNQAQSQSRRRDAAAGPTPAQMDFFHSTNAAAVSSVVDAIESQVERLLPEGISKSARNRLVGEIYRELDTTLRGNRYVGDSDGACADDCHVDYADASERHGDDCIYLRRESELA
jgi:hypothetical protein